VRFVDADFILSGGNTGLIGGGLNTDTMRPFVKRISFRFGLTLFFFLLFYLYFWKRIDPSLVYQEQESVFFFGHAFFRSFLNRPGGCVEYVSAFLSQFYMVPWVGALIVTAIAWLAAQSIVWMVQGLNGPRSMQAVHLAPAGLLLMLHSNSVYPLAASLGFIASLICFNIYIRIAPRSAWLRHPVFGLLAVSLYCLAGGSFLLFAVLCAVMDLRKGERPGLNRWLTGLSYLLFAVAMPVLFRETLFMVTLKGAYLGVLPFDRYYRPTFTPYALYALPPALVLAELFVRHRTSDHSPKGDRRSFFSRWQDFFAGRNNWSLAFKTLLVFASAGLGASLSFNPVNHTLLRVDFFARRKMWPQVLQTAGIRYSEYGIIAYQVNRALYHLGRLPDGMFAYPQRLGIEALFLPERFRYLVPLQYSDLFFELGNVNEAQHWAHEAVSQRGETPWNLQRLVQTYLIKGEAEPAHLCLNRLKRTVFFRKWAERYERILERDTLLLEDDELRRLRAVMPDSDFVMNSREPYLNLNRMLSEKRPNRMAFEYLMASYLLQGKIGKFANRLKWLKVFHYPRIPAHYEEALLWYLAQKGGLKSDLTGYTVSSETLKRFRDFFTILSRVQGNRGAAYEELKRYYGNTYWFFGTYQLANLKSQAPANR
jgi:tetratricopeptide (TPR) repeat protein